ncbi:hypothetical protein BJ138DRAFT_1008006 [Hygrophoropsis aurantiaca]|uniref:Uncharacterized protein n=1 Tax=Hygrophoropsis aurantiaca TaxID=72124 RepID=A0ACB8ABR5_9AGAM|nr:hypothetical protein BJ138DRAFT_1008006 [Hygrophoropsis aurantiaca]
MIYTEVRYTPEFRKASTSNLRRFATDVALIAHSVRCSYLVDAISARNPMSFFSQLLQALRSKDILFSDLIHLHDPTSMQSFILNTRLLDGLGDGYGAASSKKSGDPWTTCVRLDNPPVALASPPDQVIQTLRNLQLAVHMRENGLLTINLPKDLTITTLVPLAAYLLEYPVALVPSSDEAISHLSGESLHVYEAIIHGSSGSDSHTFLKFSCPAVVSDEALQLLPAQLIRRLHSRFDSRLADIGMSLTVQHHTVTLDRVAL